jgi:hypothetical protein
MTSSDAGADPDMGLPALFLVKLAGTPSFAKPTEAIYHT